jgi:hypothetical protein
MFINQSAMPAIAPTPEQAEAVAKFYGLKGLEQRLNGCWYAYYPRSGAQIRITVESYNACFHVNAFMRSLISA